MADLIAGSDSNAGDASAILLGSPWPSANIPSSPTGSACDAGVNCSSKQSVSATGSEFAIIAERAQFDALQVEWDALFERAGRAIQVFQSFNWLWHWANCYLDNNTSLSIVIARRGGRLVLVWPLVMTRIFGLKKLCWMGAPTSQYGDVLVDEQCSTRDLLAESWACLKSLNADVIHLRKVRSDAAISPLLPELGAICTGCSAAPFMDLSAASDFKTYSRRYSAKKRSDWRRHLRKLHQSGGISFEQHACGVPARDLASRAIALKRAWLSQRGIIFPPLQDDRFDRFFRAVASDPARSPGTRISALRCDGEPIGIEISLQCKGHVFGLVISYSLDFAKAGAGTMVAQYSIRTAHESGHTRFDLLAPADAHKMGWADGSVAVSDWAIGSTLAGALYARAWLSGGRHCVKRAALGLPRWVVRTLSCLRTLHAAKQAMAFCSSIPPQRRKAPQR
jgi:CelD/BcsL family acetyltransferase involved in cellulose biosynthesis